MNYPILNPKIDCYKYKKEWTICVCVCVFVLCVCVCVCVCVVYSDCKQTNHCVEPTPAVETNNCSST